MEFCTSLWIRGNTKQHPSSVGGSLTLVPGQKQTSRSHRQLPKHCLAGKQCPCAWRKSTQRSPYHCDDIALEEWARALALVEGTELLSVSLPITSAVLHPGSTIAYHQKLSLLLVLATSLTSVWAVWPKHRSWLARRGDTSMFHSVCD